MLLLSRNILTLFSELPRNTNLLDCKTEGKKSSIYCNKEKKKDELQLAAREILSLIKIEHCDPPTALYTPEREVMFDQWLQILQRPKA